MSDLTDRLRQRCWFDAADEIDRLTAERDALREQLALAESVRAAQVAGLTEGAEKLRERVRVLEDALRHVDGCLSINDYGDYALLSLFDAGIVGAALGDKT